ncbi:MAG: metalloregulator ArsR/SmtB family transcription factor [Verrucomicrobia bacterium]|nr:metalloregulator ArsR/SmtB family transcription factor [Verrucomicrobiota bacterium]
MSDSMRANMGEEAIEMIAARFRVLGEASRLKLIMALEDGEKNVSVLVAITGQTQANVSRQLQALTEAGILVRRKEGLHVIYRIADKSIFDMCDHVCGSLQRRIDSQAGAFRPPPAKHRKA